MTTTTKERIARLEARAADQERAMLRLIAEAAATNFAFGLVRDVLMQSGMIDLAGLRASADVVLAAYTAGGEPGNDAMAEAVRAALAPLLADSAPVDAIAN